MDMTTIVVDYQGPDHITSIACDDNNKLQCVNGDDSTHGKITQGAKNSASGVEEDRTEDVRDGTDEKEVGQDITKRTGKSLEIDTQKQEYELLLRKKERLDKIFLAFDDHYRKRRQHIGNEEDVTPADLMKSADEDKKAVSKAKRIRRLCDSISDSVNIVSDAAGGRVVRASKKRARERQARNPPAKQPTRATQTTVQRIFRKIGRSLHHLCCLRGMQVDEQAPCS